VTEARGVSALPLDQSAALLGGYRWIEHRLFELTGAAAPGARPPAVQLHLDEVSTQHAWHAELWAQRLPVLDGTDPESLTQPIGAAGPLLSALSAHVSGGAPDATNGTGAARLGSVRLLAGLYRVILPRLIVTYEAHLARAAPVADGPTIRALRLVLRDELESWRAGEALLQVNLTLPQDVSEATGIQAALESVIVAEGAGGGLVRWPEQSGATES
jgi:hypothetical protein